jgi:hypothetical protein
MRILSAAIAVALVASIAPASALDTQFGLTFSGGGIKPFAGAESGGRVSSGNSGGGGDYQTMSFSGGGSANNNQSDDSSVGGRGQGNGPAARNAAPGRSK